MRSSRPARPATPVLAVLIAVAAVLGAGCSSDDTAATTTTARRATSVPTSSSTAAPATTAGGAATTSIPEDTPGDALPDGDQVGYLKAIDLGAGTVTVDLAELLTGPEAVAAYQQDTGNALDGDPVYVRNRNPKLRTVPIDPGGTYAVIYSASCCGPTSVTLDGLAEAIGGDWQGVTAPNPPFNLTVQDGRVTAAVQIYQP
jgi:hypothetical protein